MKKRRSGLWIGTWGIKFARNRVGNNYTKAKFSTARQLYEMRMAKETRCGVSLKAGASCTDRHP